MTIQTQELIDAHKNSRQTHYQTRTALIDRLEEIIESQRGPLTEATLIGLQLIESCEQDGDDYVFFTKKLDEAVNGTEGHGGMVSHQLNVLSRIAGLMNEIGSHTHPSELD